MGFIERERVKCLVSIFHENEPDIANEQPSALFLRSTFFLVLIWCQSLYIYVENVCAELDVLEEHNIE